MGTGLSKRVKCFHCQSVQETCRYVFIHTSLVNEERGHPISLHHRLKEPFFYHCK